MQNIDQFDYITPLEGEKNPYLNIRFIDHGAYLGYVIYKFTDGHNFYIHIKDYNLGEPVETKEVDEVTFNNFAYQKDYLKDLILLDSIWELYKDRLLNGETLEEILAITPGKEDQIIEKMPEAWKSARLRMKNGMFYRPPLLTGGRNSISRGDSK